MFDTKHGCAKNCNFASSIPEFGFYQPYIPYFPAFLALSLIDALDEAWELCDKVDEAFGGFSGLPLFEVALVVPLVVAFAAAFCAALLFCNRCNNKLWMPNNP